MQSLGMFFEVRAVCCLGVKLHIYMCACKYVQHAIHKYTQVRDNLQEARGRMSKLMSTLTHLFQFQRQTEIDW